MAVFGVRKPNPTSLYHLRPPLPTFDDLTFDLEFKKMCGCFWKALSDWTVNSVAMFAEFVVSSRKSFVVGRGGNVEIGVVDDFQISRLFRGSRD